MRDHTNLLHENRTTESFLLSIFTNIDALKEMDSLYSKWYQRILAVSKYTNTEGKIITVQPKHVNTVEEILYSLNYQHISQHLILGKKKRYNPSSV